MGSFASALSVVYEDCWKRLGTLDRGNDAEIELVLRGRRVDHGVW